MTIGMNNLGTNGRLGNQMFQYAALVGIAKQGGFDFRIPDHSKATYFDRKSGPNIITEYHQLQHCFEMLHCGDRYGLVDGDEIDLHDAVYRQDKYSASMTYPCGHVTEYNRNGNLWCLVADDGENERMRLHIAQGHAHHNRKCKFCLMGRMRDRQHRKVKVPVQPQKGITVYTDLMGPFPEDLLGMVYELTLLV